MSAAGSLPPGSGGPDPTSATNGSADAGNSGGRQIDDTALDALLRQVLRGAGITRAEHLARTARLHAMTEIQRAATSDSTSLPHRVLTIVRGMLDARTALNADPGDQNAWMTLAAGWRWLPTLREEIDTYLDGPNWTWAAPECRPGAVAGRRSRAGVESYEIRRCPAALRDEPHPPHLDQADGWACAGVLTDPADGDGLDPAVHDPDHRPDTHAGEWS